MLSKNITVHKSIDCWPTVIIHSFMTLTVKLAWNRKHRCQKQWKNISFPLFIPNGVTYSHTNPAGISDSTTAKWTSSSTKTFWLTLQYTYVFVSIFYNFLQHLEFTIPPLFLQVLQIIVCSDLTSNKFLAFVHRETDLVVLCVNMENGNVGAI